MLVLRDQHPRWGPTRIVYELTREGVEPVPGRSSVYRALVRNGQNLINRLQRRYLNTKRARPVAPSRTRDRHSTVVASPLVGNPLVCHTNRYYPLPMRSIVRQSIPRPVGGEP